MKSKKLLNYRNKNSKFLSKKILFGGLPPGDVEREPIFDNLSGLGLTGRFLSGKDEEILGNIKHDENKFFTEDPDWNDDINALCQEVFNGKSINTLIKDTVIKMNLLYYLDDYYI